jgi:hypothetical protein
MNTPCTVREIINQPLCILQSNRQTNHYNHRYNNPGNDMCNCLPTRQQNCQANRQTHVNCNGSSASTISIHYRHNHHYHCNDFSPVTFLAPPPQPSRSLPRFSTVSSTVHLLCIMQPTRRVTIAAASPRTGPGFSVRTSGVPLRQWDRNWTVRSLEWVYSL